MARADGRVRPGQKLDTAFSARAWNRAQDAADVVLGDRGGLEADGHEIVRAANIALVRNDSGQPVPWLGVLEVDGVVINPNNGTLDGSNANSAAARELARKPVLVGKLPTGSGHFGVAIEAIPVGQIGRLAIGGTFACKVKVLATSHGFARSRRNDVTQLISAECGQMRLVWKQAVGNDRFGVVVAS
jgi:hypothetical protein